MKIYVGTSGWMYGWNKEGSFDWYVDNSGLNAVELNASFYRFPFRNQVKAWGRKSKNLRWAVKVHRSITHFFKFSLKSFARWEYMQELFSPLDDLVDFYLFQLPPFFTPEKRKAIEKFIEFTNLGKRFALEPRDSSWWSNENIEWAKELKITWVSVDAPYLPREIVTIEGRVYLRMHGRTDWYSHYYTDDELIEIYEKILSTHAEKVYIFFNNNHAMLENAQRMFLLFKRRLNEGNDFI